MVPEAITFDCYGTLIDWEGAVASFLAELLEPLGRAGEASELQTKWERLQFQAIAGPWRPYRAILADTMAELLTAEGVPFRAEDVERFAASMGTWPPFPDTVPALSLLARHVRLVLVTNTDEATAAETVRRLGVPFHDVVTAEAARAYKPDPRPFQLALERLRLPVDQVWHAAFGFDYDIRPAKRLGFFTVWVNRARAAGATDVVEDLMVGDLRTLSWVVAGVTSLASSSRS